MLEEACTWAYTAVKSLRLFTTLMLCLPYLCLVTYRRGTFIGMEEWQGTCCDIFPVKQPSYDATKACCYSVGIMAVEEIYLIA